MFAKVKSPVFIDAVKLELSSRPESSLHGIIRDEDGSICRTLETSLKPEESEFTWNGLNELPYGVYTLELTQGDAQMKLRLVKRV